MSRRQGYWLVGAILALIALGGFVLWWPPGAPANGSNQLGAALLGATIIALAVLVAEYLVSTQMREIAARDSLAARERELQREEADKALQRQLGERIDKWVLQFMASFQQDLRRIDLSGRDMSGLYLGACNFLRANLKGTNLSGATLSGAYLVYPNRQIEQDMGTSKLNQRQPVSCLLRPTSAQTTTLDEPRNRALHYPSPRWINPS